MDYGIATREALADATARKDMMALGLVLRAHGRTKDHFTFDFSQFRTLRLASSKSFS